MSRGDLGYLKRALVVAVASGKGGVQKSTTTANVALALGASGVRTGVIDADYRNPNLTRLFGLHGQKVKHEPDARHQKFLPFEVLEGVWVFSIGSVYPADTPLLFEGRRVRTEIRQSLVAVRWPPLDVLLFDLPAGGARELLFLKELFGRAFHGLLVSSSDYKSMDDVRRLARLCQHVGVPVLGVIETFGPQISACHASSVVCSTCKKEQSLFPHGRVEGMAQELQIPFLGSVPSDPRVAWASDDEPPRFLYETCTAFQQAAKAVLDARPLLTKVRAAFSKGAT